jgi:hypothetical protein
LRNGRVKIRIIILLGVVSVVSLLSVIPNFFKKRDVSANFSCMANLRQIEGAKQQWTVENKKLATDVPADSDIYGPTLYIRAKPLCPQGGTYSLNAVSAAPTCSKSGAPDFHTL